MSVVGLTELLPSAGRLAPPLIDTLVALVVFQVRLEDPPTVIEDGVALKLSMLTGSGAGGEAAAEGSSRWPGYYYRSDYPDLDDQNWRVFVNSRYDAASDKWNLFTKPYINLIK